MDMDEQEYFDFIRKGTASEEQFLQEYMCQPADDAGAFLSYDMIASCEYRPTENWEYSDSLSEAKDKELYIGVDIGRTSDLTVVWILERVTGTFFTRKIICMQNKTFSEQEAVLYEVLAVPAVKRCCIDSTGLGMQFAERAIEKFGSYRVEAVRFSAQIKEEMAYPVRSLFEDKAVKVPKDDEIRADLRGIRKVTTAAGNIRFEADRGKNGHSDRFWALALGVHAASDPPGEISYKSTTKRRFTKKGAW